jgi:hypothetical protein
LARDDVVEESITIYRDKLTKVGRVYIKVFWFGEVSLNKP